MNEGCDVADEGLFSCIDDELESVLVTFFFLLFLARLCSCVAVDDDDDAVVDFLFC